MRGSNVSAVANRPIGGDRIARIADTALPAVRQGRVVRVHVLVVDDHRVVAEAFATRLGVEDEVVDVATVSDPEAALDAIERYRPDVVVWDVELGLEDGISLIRQARQRFPRVQSVAVTAHDDAKVAAAALRAGAVSFVSKSAPTQELVRAVLGATRGESYVGPHTLYEVLPLLRRFGPEVTDPRLERLSPREREVLDLMVAGKDRATIAGELYVSVNTVRTHAKNILAKLEVHSTLEAVRLALEAGVRPPGRPAATGTDSA